MTHLAHILDYGTLSNYDSSIMTHLLWLKNGFLTSLTLNFEKNIFGSYAHDQSLGIKLVSDVCKYDVTVKSEFDQL